MKKKISVLLAITMMICLFCSCGAEKKEKCIGTCDFLIECSVLLEEENLAKLSEEQQKLIPENGVFLDVKMDLMEGDSPFSLLQRAVREHKLHMEFAQTPGYGSTYVEGIGNIYEFDCGQTSGWIFAVNGVCQNIAADKAILSDGDAVTWSYTCSMGDSGLTFED